TKSLFVEIESQDFAPMNGAKTSQANDSIQPEQNPAPEEICYCSNSLAISTLKNGRCCPNFAFSSWRSLGQC
ncbi:hypothetical protein, partial [Nostoc sp. KVJ3]|uniref:hypothetical protein n=1 Tax=Nostoc sp. KVJ3 TaxID=457945 RepID=UPI002237E839